MNAIIILRPRWQGISTFLEGRHAKVEEQAVPKGLYMYGGVGVGKTMCVSQKPSHIFLIDR